MTQKLQYEPPELQEVSLRDFVIIEGMSRSESLDDTESEGDI